MYEFEAVLGLIVSWTTSVSRSPGLMLPGTFNVTLFEPPPVSAPVTAPEPDGVVASWTEYSEGLFGNTVPAGAWMVMLEPAGRAALAKRFEMT